MAALIVPAFEALEAWAQKNGIRYSSREELVKHPAVVKLYQERVEKQTKDLGQVEKPKKFAILPVEFSQETGELTPTSKIKRKVIAEKYKDVIDSLFED